MGEPMQQAVRTPPGKLPLIGHTGRPALDPPAFLERPRTSDQVGDPLHFLGCHRSSRAPHGRSQQEPEPVA
jgi:hypothetical protein